MKINKKIFVVVLCFISIINFSYSCNYDDFSYGYNDIYGNKIILYYENEKLKKCVITKEGLHYDIDKSYFMYKNNYLLLLTSYF